MVSVEHITIVSTDETDARFYEDALGLGARVRVQGGDAPTSGFRGFLLGLVVGQPADIDHLIGQAQGAGASVLKPATKSLWGYGGVVKAPDGTIVTLASSSKKNTGPVTRSVDEIVLQLGVEDVAASRQFYEARGFAVGKSYGRKYVEFDTRPLSFTLNRRGDLAKNAGVPAEGTGSHRVLISADGEPFTDPDGYMWERHGSS